VKLHNRNLRTPTNNISSLNNIEQTNFRRFSKQTTGKDRTDNNAFVNKVADMMIHTGSNIAVSKPGKMEFSNIKKKDEFIMSRERRSDTIVHGERSSDS
jgi:hypothetical protein